MSNIHSLRKAGKKCNCGPEHGEALSLQERLK